MRANGNTWASGLVCSATGVQAPDGVRLFLKNEAGNPTGSFKDRGLSLAVNRARELGAPGVQLPSAGNAGVAAAAYAAAAGFALSRGSARGHAGNGA